MNSPLINSTAFGLALVFVLSVVTAIGAFEGINLAMVDQIFRLFPNAQTTPPILLVSTTEADRSRMQGLVAALHQQQPRSIYVIGPVPRSAEPGMQALPGVKLVDYTSWMKSTSYAGSPASERAGHLAATPVLLKAGYYRLWQRSERIDSTVHTGFQASLGPLEKSTSNIIDFTMEDGFLPLVTASRVLSEGLTPALIRDKVVLVGEALQPGMPGFTVPIRSATGISSLELQGYVLHSALDDRLLGFTGFIVTLLGVLLLGAVATLLFQWLPSHISALLTIAICLFIVVLQWAAVKFSATILPAWELIIAQLANLLAIYQLQRNREEQTLNQIIAKTNSRLSERVQPINFNRSDDPWKKILSLVNQQLNIKRSIFLEKVPADHRVTEIEALNCSIDDISERRRDYEREPYSAALEANGPIVPFRDYFTEVEPGEAQYMVPLSFGGDVLGFWALTLIPADNWNRVAFESNVRSFSLQIAELLYHRQHWHNRWQKGETVWRKLLSVEAGLTLHRQLNNTVDLLENRLDILEDVLNGLSTAVIVYDVFGQVLHTNNIIEHLAQENDVAVYKLTAMELLARSNNIALDEARNKLRYVTLKQQTLVQNSTLFSSRGSYLLYIRPLLVKQDSNLDQVQPFQIRGILFEFADLTQIQKHDEIRQEIADQYFSQIRSNLSAIGHAVSDLTGEEQGQSLQQLNSIMDKVSESNELTDRVEEELRNQIHMREQTVPTNLVPIIGRLIDSMQEASLDKELSFQYEVPESSSLNFVEPKTFEQLIVAILNLLIADAIHGTSINVAIGNQSSANIHVTLTNTGQGMPSDQLEQTLSTYQSYLDMSDDPLTQVSVLTQQVLLWGGEVSFKSKIGTGYSIDILLRTFNLSLPVNKPDTPS